MSAAGAPTWLGQAYFAALAVHAGVLLLLLVLATALGVELIGGSANAAPNTMLFAGATVITVLLPGVPSIIALLSWHLCRRQGTAPSPGHMGLSIAGALAVVVILLAASIF